MTSIKLLFANEGDLDAWWEVTLQGVHCRTADLPYRLVFSHAGERVSIDVVDTEVVIVGESATHIAQFLQAPHNCEPC